jgi:dihydroflavonol-4-reductase
MKIAVTGAAGHIGGVICRELLEKGYEVVGLVYADTTALEGLPIQKIQGDVLNRDSLKKLLNGCDAVIHTAAAIELGYKFNEKIYNINVVGTKNVLEVAKELSIAKIVCFSSIHAYNHTPQNQPLDETREFVSDNSVFYDQTKRDAHRLAIQASEEGQHVVVVCPTSAVGPYDFKPSKLGKAILDLYAGKIPMVTAGGFDFADVRDMAKGAILALEKGKSGETYILGGKYYTLKEFSSFVMKAKNKSKALMELPIGFAYIGLPFIKLFAMLSGKPPLFDKVYIDILQDGNKLTLSDKAKKELGYTVRPLEETIADTILWFKQNNKIN